MDRTGFLKQRLLVCLGFVVLVSQAVSAQHLYVGNDNPAGGIREYNLPLTASSTPNFTLPGNSIVSIGLDASGNLVAGALGGGLTFFTAPLTASSTPAATFNNGTSTNNGAILFIPSGDFFAATAGNAVNRFTPPFNNLSTPSQTITHPAFAGTFGLALDAAQNLYISSGGSSGGNLFVYAPPYNGSPIIITPNIPGTVYRKIALSATQLIACSVGGTTGRIDVYNLPIAVTSTPAFSITSAVNLPEAVSLDGAGNLYVGNLGDATVSVFTPPFSASSTPATILKVSTGQFSIFGIAIGNPPLPGGTLPGVASAAGAFNSFFRTGVQLHDGGSSPMTGRIVFHRAGSPGTDPDPFLSYTLSPGETQNIADLLPAMGQSGLGSADVFPNSGGLPTVVARVFNDGGSNGTVGFTEDLVKPGSALAAGDQVSLLVPADLARFRYNIGIRVISSGAVITITLRNSSGVVVNTLSKTYLSPSFEQVGAAAFLGGAAPAPNDSIDVRVDSGNLFIYGATTDNTTQDPSIQLGRK